MLQLSNARPLVNGSHYTQASYVHDQPPIPPTSRGVTQVRVSALCALALPTTTHWPCFEMSAVAEYSGNDKRYRYSLYQ